jgi:deoxyribodipyrimidine photolyase
MKNKTLVWVTHSFRLDSRLTNSLEGECTFVYYSPFYFAGSRERQILKRTSQSNLDAFYFSLNQFKLDLQNAGSYLYVYKKKDPIEHINFLCKELGYTRVIIDQPLFAMWHTVDLLRLSVPYEMIDSDLIDDQCFKMTAKSRWMSHVKKNSTEKVYKWNPNIVHKGIPTPDVDTYPIPTAISYFIDKDAVIDRSFEIAPNYGSTRDHHDGQTQLSTLLQNGMVDPHNLFFEMSRMFESAGSDLSVNEGAHASMLRQFAFREMNIIHARRNNLTMENTPLEWAQTVMHSKALENMLQAKPNPNSQISIKTISESNTGVTELDKILRHFNQTGIMPNRARMYFAGKVFYESKTGLIALENLIDTFVLIGLDGQCPNNYMQCISSLGLSYGKVMLLSPIRTFDLLQYKN